MDGTLELFPDARSVSTIVGTILLVGIVITLIALLAPISFSGLLQDSPPQADFKFEKQGQQVHITHWNGNSIPSDQIKVIVNGHLADNQFEGNFVDPGNSVTVEAVGGDNIRVVWESAGGPQTSVLDQFIVPD